MNNTITDRYFFKGVKISILNLDILNGYDFESSLKETGYFCVTDVGNVVNAYRRSKMLKEAINGSSLSLPDGRPLSIFGKLIGFRNIGRTSGAEVMKCLFKVSLEKGYSHCFIGDTEEIHKKLKTKIEKEYSGLIIKGFFCPPFIEWSKETNDKIIEVINSFDADFVWISFGGGKQEIWMYENRDKFNRGTLIGIGAGFRWFLGEIKQAPVFLQKLSMEWLFRLIQQPRKMFTRYITTLPFFAKDAMIEIVKIKLLGKKVN